MTSPKLHTVNELAARFGIHPITVRKKVAAGEWPCLRLGTKTIRFTDEHLAAILASSEVPARTA